MRVVLMVLTAMISVASSAETGDLSRFESFLCNSGRFFESDYDDEDAQDIPNRSLDAVPLFQDVMEANGWSTNDLVSSLIHVVSNGLVSSNWESAEAKRSVAVAIRQLSNINHPAVTNYFSSIVSSDLHGLEKIVIPGLFKYTYLEQEVMDRLQALCVQTNRYDRAAAIVAWDLLDCLSSMPDSERETAKLRVARYMYFSMRQVTSSQTWQDEKLAELIPSYSNSVERLNQMRYLMLHSERSYERERATIQFNRLSAMPTNALNNVQWINSETILE